jgi:predicted DNA-binding transcriptional regulator
LGEETAEKILKDIGLTEKEIEVYIFLAKRGALKTREAARQIKKDKAQVLRILKSLQSKGLAESTLEVPKRFTAVPFEKVLNAFVKAKRDEANLIESAKKELLLHWKSSGKAVSEAPLEKFVVVEGTDKIYSKISEMMTEAKNQLSAVFTIQGLVRSDQMGLFEIASNHPLRPRIQLRFLTELPDQRSDWINTLFLKASKAGISFRGKNPDLGFSPSPRMVIRDEEEVFLFITPSTDIQRAKPGDTGLWTNCKTLVQTFASVFEDLWRNATETQQETVGVDAGHPPPRTFILSNLETVNKKYDEIVASANQEIKFMTSPQGIIDLWKKMKLLGDLTQKGVSIKIMAPITVKNWEAVQQLSKWCEIRHIPERRSKTILVDGTHLFHFRNLASDQEISEKNSHAFGAFYTSDSKYVAKSKATLNDAWKNAQPPSTVTLESILNPPPPSVELPRKTETARTYTKTVLQIEEHQVGTIAEKDVLNKILNAKRIIAKDPLRDTSNLCGCSAQAVIHPPELFNLPDMMVNVWHCDKQSSWGAEDWLTVSLWLNTPKGYKYVAVAHVTDNPEALEFRKGIYTGLPASRNCQLINKDQFQVQIHGNTLFAGWTVPIPLLPQPYVLPPACMLFEGHGELKTAVTTIQTPLGRTLVTEANRFDAFVTFFHPASKYSGPGTDGVFNRDAFLTSYPPA